MPLKKFSKKIFLFSILVFLSYNCSEDEKNNLTEDGYHLRGFG